jgi:hypothetical protein
MPAIAPDFCDVLARRILAMFAAIFLVIPYSANTRIMSAFIFFVHFLISLAHKFSRFGL